MTERPKISDYGLIGDCQTCALVGRDGSIDWMCLPRFDSAAVFASLLGSRENGRFRIAPRDQTGVSRRYRPHTLILETEFTTTTGKARIVDFMPIRDGLPVHLVRIVEGIEGTVTFDLELWIRFDYGRTIPWVTRRDEQTLVAIAGADALVVRTPIRLEGKNKHTAGTVEVGAGDRVPVVLTHSPSHLELPEPCDPDTALRETAAFWHDYAGTCTDLGPDTEIVKRSLITLKALTYRPTGGIVAAATTSLPEEIGGERNWDYRYCWLRDATMTLVAFMELGYYEEAKSWRNWLLRAIAGDARQVQIMYGVTGERRLPEWEVDWLEGFAKSRPVRVGNAASDQRQIDIFGEVIDMLARAHERIGGVPRSDELRREMLTFLETSWDQPDAGIWEPRSGPRHHVHSKVMAWVAFDRAATAFGNGDDDLSEEDAARARRWREIADRIHADVCARGFDTELGSFVQSYGAKNLDAALLFIPLTGFLPADDPRVTGTVAAIERELMIDGGYVRRYAPEQTDDGLAGGEGVFLACSFWLADVWILQGRLAEARALLDRMVGLCNDCGLLPEEVDPATGEFLGNLPQAFSHVGLIVTALSLARAEAGAGQEVGE